MTDRRRFLVAEAPMFWPRDRRARCLPVTVGVYPWTMPEHALSIIVRASLRLGGRGDELDSYVDPTPLAIGKLEGGARSRPDDFLPLKGGLDLLVVGHVEMHGVPNAGVYARRGVIALGESAETFVIACGAPGRVPLRPPYTRWLDGTDAELGPGPASAAWTDGGNHPADFDFDLYQHGDPNLRFEGMPVGDDLVLSGIGEEGERIVTKMPEIAPRLFFDPAQPEDPPRDVVLKLDTILADLDRRVVDLTWRGFLALRRPPRFAVDRLVIGWVDVEAWREEDAGRAWRNILKELPRGRFAWAVERSDVEAGVAPPALTDDELTMARYTSWDQVAAATPELDMRTRARIAAELAEQREPRRDVLFRHGLDEHGWALEERATVEELASTPTSPAEADRQRVYAETFVEAQDALARPEEDRLTIDDFARLLARAEQGTHEEAMRSLNVGMGALFRLDRKWRRRADADPQLRKELELALERARAEAEASPRPEVQDT